MGTKIYRENYLPGYQYDPARNINEITANSNWSLFCANKTIQNGPHCNGTLPRTVTNLFSGYEKDAIKHMMLTQEAAFKHQVSELHRLYKVQKEIMNEIKRKELYRHQILIVTPPSSSLLVHRVPYHDPMMRWHKSPFPTIDPNDREVLESRPSKTRKQLFNFDLSSENHIDLEEEKTARVNMLSDILNNSCTRNSKPELGIGEKMDSKVQFFDLNKPFLDDDVGTTSTNITGVGNSKPHLEFVTPVPQDLPPIHIPIDINMKSTKDLGVNTTFSKLLSDEILKANGSSNNKEIYTNSSHVTHTIGGKIGLIDINLVCEVDADVAESENEKEAADIVRHIDLNLCASEDEITLVPSFASTSIEAKIASDKDLEVLALADSEKDTSSLHKTEKPSDEPDTDTSAAMAIVAMSSFVNINRLEESSQDPAEDPPLEGALLWFSRIASSDLENALQELDEFEAMTLNLTELEEEEYMPTPHVLENLEMEAEAEAEAVTLPRRGKARRGRQKRDFQKEILPGMVSLSRHEVAEDVQTFGKIMKNMGCSWPVLAKRNGGGRRGRRRLVAKAAPFEEPVEVCKPLEERSDSVEIGLEERVLNRWGKTPRRPRGRRCHVTNLSSVALS